MSNKGPIGIAQQLNYLIEWFLEYSDYQKEDFHSTLLEMYSKSGVNGVSSSLENLELGVGGRPPSIFQCRMKLLREWFEGWGEEERGELLERLGRVDEKFAEKLNAEMGGGEE